ncbi:hypothetical protein SVIOM74S_00050 [Streptomyces violarus]
MSRAKHRARSDMDSPQAEELFGGAVVRRRH